MFLISLRIHVTVSVLLVVTEPGSNCRKLLLKARPLPVFKAHCKNSTLTKTQHLGNLESLRGLVGTHHI